MLRKFVFFSIALLVTTLLALSYITGRYLDKEQLQRVQAEMAELTQEKINLEARVLQLDEQQVALHQKIESKNSEIAHNKMEIVKLETVRDEQKLGVRRLRTEDALEKSFATAYPQVIDAKNFGIVNMPIDNTLELTLPFYVIPAWFTETFIIEHNNMLVYKKQINEYKANEELYGNVLDLKNQVIQLQTDKSDAYQDGYEEAFEKYDALNKEYIALLKKPPKVEIKAPSLWPTVGGLLLGLTVAVGI